MSETWTKNLETYEWDNVWWEQAADTERPRVLYIGDSISCGIRRVATELSHETVLFDGFGTSKALDNPYLSESIRLFGKQQGRRSLVLFNNGLHGFHLSDGGQYRDAYEGIVRFLMAEFAGTPLALVLTTSAADERNERVTARNRSVKMIAEKYSLPVIDLYEPSLRYADLHSDVFHFNEAGNKKLAQALLDGALRLMAAR